ncbi:hypothetical protein DEO72_LG10g667 [Vigna unguiculata]|uniref:DUF7803 domain-containing protein n=1 Tax=Vigna unguiculata TaxID=3917 RepID=A0A4D6N828_VIGUN|nr:hypothetical protein DEO72_LG10g665 [Vigna unguiculata]QCE09448.1 hypothetical protein DEO72_LG10g667 [Vigna unguiculata]
MPLDEAKGRASQLEAEVTSLERRLILASGVEGIEGFRQRWSLHGRLTDSKIIQRGKTDHEPMVDGLEKGLLVTNNSESICRLFNN